MEVSNDTIKKFVEVVKPIALLAGDVISNVINQQDKSTSAKSSQTDLVTETDKAVEKLIFNKLKEEFPDHEFIGEEGVSEANNDSITLSDAPTWIVDPIDGTMNFVHSNPLVAVSIGLAIKKKLVAGIIYLPMMREMYSAIDGQGAFCNNERIQVSKVKNLEKSMIVYEIWASSEEKIREFQLNDIGVIYDKVHAIRSLGSACVSLAYVAKGHIDAYYQSGLRIWDMAAGAVIVKEAGGVVSNIHGEEFNAMEKNILVAADEQITNELVALKLKSPIFKPEHPSLKCTL